MRIMLATALIYLRVIGKQFKYQKEVVANKLHLEGSSELLASFYWDKKADKIQIYCRDGDRLIALAYATMYNNSVKLCTIGFFVDRAYRKQGIATELMKRLKVALDRYPHKKGGAISCASWIGPLIERYMGSDYRIRATLGDSEEFPE